MIAASALAAVGCAKGVPGRPKLVPAGGRVVYNGQPLEGAHVTFFNAESNVAAYAQTNADGTFSLTTFDPNDGAVPGQQKISVSKVKITGPEPDPNEDRIAIPPEKLALRKRVWLIPERYGSPATSGLTADIPDSGKTDIVVELRGP
jgi:hypothetical protein